MNRMLKSFLAIFAIVGLLCTGVFAQDKNGPISGEKQITRVRVEHQPATIEKAQQALKNRGLYRGEATGKMDSATKDAVKSFQQQEGLNSTGHLNKETREKLGIEPTDPTAGAVKSSAKSSSPSKRSAKKQAAAHSDESK